MAPRTFANCVSLGHLPKLSQVSMTPRLVSGDSPDSLLPLMARLRLLETRIALVFSTCAYFSARGMSSVSSEGFDRSEMLRELSIVPRSLGKEEPKPNGEVLKPHSTEAAAGSRRSAGTATTAL